MSQFVTETDSLIEKESEEEIAEQTEDAGRETNHHVEREEEQKNDASVVKEKPGVEQVGHRNYVIMITIGATQDLPSAASVLSQVMEQLKHQKELDGGSSTNVAIKPVLKPEEEKATKSVAEEISSTSNKIQADLLSGSSIEERQKLAKAINELTSALVTEFTGVTLDDEALTARFDNALTNLFQVPVAEQSPAQLVVTFVKMSLFSMMLINLCKKEWDNPSICGIASTAMIIGSALHQVADKHGLNTWVQNNGGWCGLCSKVHDFIVQLTLRQTSDNSTTTDGQENAVSIPWPSSNTIILFGGLTVFVGLYAYYKFK